jgi:hypothetical protein
METNTEEAHHHLRPLEAPCAAGCTKPVDLRRRCMWWPSGRVAHLDCYNRARLGEQGRPSSQRTLPIGGVA